MHMGINNRSNLCSGYVLNPATVTTPERNTVRVATSRPDEDTVKLWMALHQQEILLHSGPYTPPSLFPTVFLRYFGSESRQRKRSLTFHYVANKPAQNRYVFLIKESLRIRSDILCIYVLDTSADAKFNFESDSA